MINGNQSGLLSYKFVFCCKISDEILGVSERCRIFAFEFVKKRMMIVQNLSILHVVDVIVVLCREA